MTWAELLAAYRDRLASTGRAPTTWRTYGPWLERWIAFCHDEDAHQPNQVTEAHVARWQQRLRWGSSRHGSLYRPSTIDLALRAVRGLLRWAVAQGLLLADPTAHLVLKKPVTRRRWLEPDEMERLLAQPDPLTPVGLRDRAILETLYGVGVRRQECRQLDLEHLDLAGRVLRVHRGKGGRSRVLPVGETMAEALEHYVREARSWMVRRRPAEPALFVTWYGTRLGDVSLQLMLRRYGRRAGLDPLPSPHVLRHSCGTHLLQGGAGLREVQQLLGHATVQATETYTHLVPQDLMREHARTHPRSRRRESGEAGPKSGS